MSILKKLMTAVRASALDMGELWLDSADLRTFEQEIRHAQAQLRRAKHDLTEVMAQQMQASRRLQSMLGTLSQQEALVGSALDQGNEGLARQLAGKMALLEADLAGQQEEQERCSEQVQRLQQVVHKSGRQVKEFERQLSMLKTAESVQKASVAIAANFAASSSRMLSARDSLARIKQRQQHEFDQLIAMEELLAADADNSLEQQMLAAGIVEQPYNADQVLARIRAGRAAAEDADGHVNKQ
jgi:phage shock protein A